MKGGARSVSCLNSYQAAVMEMGGGQVCHPHGPEHACVIPECRGLTEPRKEEFHLINDVGETNYFRPKRINLDSCSL